MSSNFRFYDDNIKWDEVPHSNKECCQLCTYKSNKRSHVAKHIRHTHKKEYNAHWKAQRKDRREKAKKERMDRINNIERDRMRMENRRLNTPSMSPFSSFNGIPFTTIGPADYERFNLLQTNQRPDPDFDLRSYLESRGHRYLETRIQSVSVEFSTRGVQLFDSPPIQTPVAITHNEQPKNLEKHYMATTCPSCLEEQCDQILTCGHFLCGDCNPKITNRKCPLCRVSNLDRAIKLIPS